MDEKKLTIKYCIGWNGKPKSTDDSDPQGVMEIYLDKAFETYKTNAGVEKCFQVVNRRKIIKFILQVGSDENIEQLHEWFKNNSKLWLKEFKKLSDGRW